MLSETRTRLTILSMFFKPFKVKSQTSIKGSDRKRLRSQVGKRFPDLTAETLAELVPSKDDMIVYKIYTASGESAVVYVVQKNPVFFEVYHKLYPSVYTLWKCPDLLPVFATWPPVFSKLAGGADLMLPGVVTGKGGSLPIVNKGDICSVKLVGNRVPVAMGIALKSSGDMKDSGMKGKGVRVCHILGDALWSFGDKSEPPLISDPEFETVSDVQTGNEEDTAVENEVLPVDSSDVQWHSVSEVAVSGVETDHAEGGDDPQGAEGGGDIQESAENIESETEENTLTTADMDRYLYEAFMTALKTKVKKSDLPLLTSNLYRNFMLPCSAGKEFLDVKKSSYKKLSKFLNAMSKAGLVKVKELSKGVEGVTDIDKSHPEYRNFIPPDIEETQASSTEIPTADQEFQPPDIQEMYSLTAVMMPIFKPHGYSKGSTLFSADVRSVIGDYVNSHNLQMPERKGVVQLDPIISDVVLNKGEVNTTHMIWQELICRFLEKMQIVHLVTFPGHAPVIKKGHLEPITIDVVQRASNKKVTLIDNLEQFGIDPTEFAHRVQKGVACSASASPVAQKNKGLLVTIQGNQITYVADLLVGKYRIQRKFIKGLEKAPKSGKKR